MKKILFLIVAVTIFTGYAKQNELIKQTDEKVVFNFNDGSKTHPVTIDKSKLYIDDKFIGNMLVVEEGHKTLVFDKSGKDVSTDIQAYKKVNKIHGYAYLNGSNLYKSILKTMKQSVANTDKIDTILPLNDYPSFEKSELVAKNNICKAYKSGANIQTNDIYNIYKPSGVEVVAISFKMKKGAYVGNNEDYVKVDGKDIQEKVQFLKQYNDMYNWIFDITCK